MFTVRRLSFYDLVATVCAYITEQNERVQIKYALLYFETEKWDQFELRQYDFVTVYRPWNDMQYIAMNKEQIQMGGIRIMAPISNCIKCDDARKRVAHFDKYPKYDANKFKNIVFRRSGIVDDYGNETNDRVEDGNDCSEDEEESEEDNMDVVMEEDDLFWLQNIDELIQSEMNKNKRDKNFEIIPNIPTFEVPNRRYNLRGIIQRIYVNADFGKDKNSKIRLLVQDTCGYCCIIHIKLSTLCNQIDNVMRFESTWFNFNDLQIDEETEDFDESAPSMLIQFDYEHLQSIGSSSEMSRETVQKCQKRQMSDLCFYGMHLNEGQLLKDGKFFYHFEHFSDENSDISHIYSFKANNAHLQRLKLRHFECNQLGKCFDQSNDNINVCYRESLLFELVDIRKYLEKFWKIKMCSTRISVAVRIICKSLLYENVIFIADNSLSHGDNVRALPIVVENVALFCSVCDFELIDNAKMYQSQPLVILRDILMNFSNLDGKSGRLELRFDKYSAIERVNDTEFMQSKCVKLSYNESLVASDALRLTPWIALSSAMVSIKGNVEMVAINDAFDKQCTECAKVSTRNEIMAENEDESVQGVGCLDCFLKNGQIRVVLKQNNEFIVVVIPAANIWCKENNFGQMNLGNNELMYLEQLNALKQRLQSLHILNECVIEHNTDCDSNGECVQSFCALHCVL